MTRVATHSIDERSPAGGTEAARYRLYVSAGEPSGDSHAAGVMRALAESGPDVFAQGLGGPELRRAGATITQPMEPLSGIGFAEVIHTLPAHYRHLARTRRAFDTGGFDLAMLVDYPGLNLRVARAAARARIPVLYYVAPQLWAWGERRASHMRRDVDHVAAILPFEQSFFNDRGIPATFVGHPLLDRRPAVSPETARERLGIHHATPVLGLLPGSRVPEVRRMWAAFRDAARAVRQAVPELQIVVAARPGLPYPEPGDAVLYRKDPDVVMAAADAVLCKSGTSTLQAALADTPMVIAYRMHALTHAIARRLVRTSHIGLVNILAGREVAPELVQDAVTADALAAAVLPLLDPHGGPATTQRDAFSAIRMALGGPGAAARTAALALELAKRGPR